MTFIDVTESVIAAAIHVTQTTGLCAYDALHLAAALSIAGGAEVIFAPGDRAHLGAASNAGLVTAATV